MKILRFIKGQSKSKFYLSYYFDYANEPCSDEYKMNLIDAFIKVTRTVFNPTSKLKYDILGPGYGISKGSPYLGEKAIRRRFNTKGYSKCQLFSIIDENENTIVQFSTDRLNRPCQYGSLSFKINKSNPSEIIRAFISQLNSSCSIRYGYGYKCFPDLVDGWEVYPTIFGTIKSDSNHRKWDDNLHLVNEGYVKKMHELNILNKEQLNNLNTIEFDSEYKVSSKLKITTLNADKVKIYNLEISNKVV